MPGPNNPHRPPTTDPTAPSTAPSRDSRADETVAAPERTPPGAGPALGPPAAAGEVGTLGPYRLVKELGRGGMGAVYAALDTRLDRRLALKLMLPEIAADPAARERFVREARAAAKVGHDNVVTVFEADVRDGVPYIAMPFLEGYPLDEYLKKKGNPSLPQVLRIGREAAAGLAAAHARGLVHRDIKPANLWLEAPAGRVKLLDFGLARPVDAEGDLTRPGAVVGTPAYMSPEQARGEKVDHRTDLFSLGVVLYRLCTGRLPFDGPTTMAVLIALGTENPQPVRELNPAVPEPLAALILQLLQKTPADRPKSADEVAARLLALARPAPTPAERAQLPVSASSQPQVVYVPIQVTAAPEANPFADLDASEAETRPGAAPPPGRREPRRRWAVAAVLAALVATVLGGVIIVIRNRDVSGTKVEVPDGATGKAPGADDTPDRKAAEWALGLGGLVRVTGEKRDIKSVNDLPKSRFTLDWVHVSGGGVTDAGLLNLKGLKGLTDLWLWQTAVTDAGLTHLVDCKALSALGCVGPPGAVADAALANLRSLDNLQNLYLDRTKVTDTGMAHLKDYKQLNCLHLNYTAVTDAGLRHLGGCRDLAELGLGGTAVTDTGLADLRDLAALDILFLNETKVTDTGLAHLGSLPRLRAVWLGKTAVGDAGVRHLTRCKSLDELSLTGTSLTDAGLATLQGCKGLIALDVRQTQVTAKGLADFHSAVPGCRVEHDDGVIEPKK